MALSINVLIILYPLLSKEEAERRGGPVPGEKREKEEEEENEEAENKEA